MHGEVLPVPTTFKAQCIIKHKRAIPFQVWTGPEGYRRLRLPDFKIIST
jgi:hypothetical protein